MKLSERQRLLGQPQDFYTYSDLGAVMNMSWAKIPSYYYYYKQYQLPFTDAEFTQLFGKNLQLFLTETPDSTIQTNAAIGSGVNEAFLAMGCGVVAIGEGEAFSMQGLDVVNDGATTNTPNVVGTADPGCEGYCGIPNATALADNAGSSFAQMWWGGPTWNMIEKFFQAYRLNLLVNRRFLVVDESLHDVGMVPTPPEFVGASDSRLPVTPFVRAVNDVMASKGIGHSFVPPNINVDTEGASTCIPPVLAPVTFGHPRIIGLSNRLYTFNQPLLFIPGMRFDMSFQALEDDAQWPELRNKVTYNNSTAVAENYIATDTPDGCGLTTTIPGGSLSLGLVLKGVSLVPKAVIDFLSQALLPTTTYESMYASLGSPWLATQIAQYDKGGQLGKLLAGVPHQD